MSEPSSAEQDTTFDLAALTRTIRAGDGYARDGHGARTLVRADDLRIVLVAMKEGAVIKEHRVRITASVHALEGRVRLQLPERAVEVAAGSVLVIPPDVPHDVQALEESAFLLTLGWKG